MAEQPLRVGVVGADGHDRWGARAHVPALRALSGSGVDLAAVCTSREETARAAAQRFGVAKWYAGHEALVRDPEIDVVTVAVRVPLHHPVSMAALEAGKHVFCEWPLALDSAQAKQLLDTAQARRLGHAVDLQARHSPGLLHMKELVDQGYLGRLLFFNMTQFLSTVTAPRPSHRWWLARREGGGSALTIATGHALDATRWLLGDVVAVCGHTETLVKEWQWSDTGERVPVDSVDTVAFLCRLAGGAVGTVHVSQVSHRTSGWRLEAHGTDGKLTATSRGMVQYTPVRLRGAHRGEEERGLRIPRRFTWVQGLTERHEAFNVAQAFSRFAQAIREGSEHHPNFADSLELHRILEAVAHSSETGRWEQVG
ncbi:MAG: Gfo/Idh/MocA family oxidoreductase [Chloroflexi bacterium]|nr:Gfo/Idh/MocA family oxidoreductase [Chloroflexota bacterium]